MLADYVDVCLGQKNLIDFFAVEAAAAAVAAAAVAVVCALGGFRCGDDLGGGCVGGRRRRLIRLGFGLAPSVAQSGLLVRQVLLVGGGLEVAPGGAHAVPVVWQAVPPQVLLDAPLNERQVKGLSGGGGGGGGDALGRRLQRKFCCCFAGGEMCSGARGRRRTARVRHTARAAVSPSKLRARGERS
ncbi:hypothetical protein TYRP_016301, partial [Tyrophagus putrescentiae]